jgi:flagellar biosynthesis chaperone FliJ
MSFGILIFQAFHHAYSFLSDVRAKEKEQLKQELKTLTDPKRKDKIKYLVQRMVIYFYCCTVLHSEDSLIITHQQMRHYVLCLF